jgi:hypothetical protein
MFIYAQITVNAKAFGKAQSVAVCKHKKLLWLSVSSSFAVVRNDMMPERETKVEAKCEKKFANCLSSCEYHACQKVASNGKCHLAQKEKERNLL